MTAAEFVAGLGREGKKQRSGLGKYLPLVEGRPTLPALQDADGRIVSLPPLTNADHTKVRINCETWLCCSPSKADKV